MKNFIGLFQRGDEDVPEVAQAISAEDALQLCLDKWGPGAFVKIVALTREKYDPVVQITAREQLAEHRRREPHLRQDEEYDGDTPISVMLADNKKWHVDHNAWERELRRLMEVAFSQRFIVGSSGGIFGYGQGHDRGDGETWEEALTKARVLSPAEVPA